MSCDTPSSSLSSMEVKRETDEDSCSSTTRHSSIRSACNQSLPIPTHYSPPKRIIQELFMPLCRQISFQPIDSFKGDSLPDMDRLYLDAIYANVIPLVLRIFHAHALRGIVQQEYQGEFTDAFKICNDLMPILTGLLFRLLLDTISISAIESLAMALFSIVTVHNDFAEFNRYCKIVFAMTASLNMLITSLVLFSFRRYVTQSIDSISVGVKIMSTALFCYFAPQYFQFHLSSISYPTCHSYLPSSLAMIEYVTTLSYMSFHFTQLIDVRHCHFVCYPRDSSGRQFANCNDVIVKARGLKKKT
ncbi:hypothetical protein WR25_02937 isoform F [Diploscapter pachys]|uniref:Uncharacterized protein n=1 Tax=Diploscapter pachys TaxID=2018661 RepID=A0A2A2L320_9BILA|nr:hypothetical protein WR25_02937 isoform F [Diploscapter pachys]